jgi:hypothetical protein
MSIKDIKMEMSSSLRSIITKPKKTLPVLLLLQEGCGNALRTHQPDDYIIL